MPTPLWSKQRLGCIDRDSFHLHPSNRTVLTSIGVPPTQSKKGDMAAPITATLQANQTRSQWLAFTQWHRMDLAGGSLPFMVDLYLWDSTIRVRARFVGPWRASRSLYNAFVLQATVEIERESIT